ncbi:MAG: hypothetical protein RI571_06615 [Roseovarius sp.]|nr:hypothetical protein [Roseovarius sp.]
MVDMVLLKPAPDAPAAIKKEKPRLVARATAVENVRLSRGAYTFENADQPAAPQAPQLEDMDRQELLQMALGMGMKTSKQMKHSDIVAFVRKKMEDVEIVDE